MTIELNSNAFFDFGDNTLTLALGSLTRTGGLTQSFVGNISNGSTSSPVAANWDVSGSGEFRVLGQVRNSGVFTKSGDGVLTLQGGGIGAALVVGGGTLKIDSRAGTLFTAAGIEVSKAGGANAGPFPVLDWRNTSTANLISLNLTNGGAVFRSSASTQTLRLGGQYGDLFLDSSAANPVSFGASTVLIQDTGPTSALRIAGGTGATFGFLTPAGQPISFVGQNGGTLRIDLPTFNYSTIAVTSLRLQLAAQLNQNTNVQNRFTLTNGFVDLPGQDVVVDDGGFLATGDSGLAARRIIASSISLQVPVAANNRFTLEGQAVAQSLSHTTAGTVRLTGATDNPLVTIDVQNGTVELAKADGTAAVNGTVLVGTLGGTTSPRLKWSANNQIPDSNDITLNRGTLELGSSRDTIRNLAFRGGTITGLMSGQLGLAGNLTADTAAALTLGTAVNLASNSSWTVASGTTLVSTAPVTGVGQTLTKVGDGTLRIEATAPTNSYADVAVRAGTLELGKTGADLSFAGFVGDLTIGKTAVGNSMPPVVRAMQPGTALGLGVAVKFDGTGGTIDLNGFGQLVSGLDVSSGTSTLTGGAQLKAASLVGGGTLDIRAGTSLNLTGAPNGTTPTFTGRLTGPGTLVIDTGTSPAQTLAGPGANTLALTAINTGRLILGKTSGLPAASGDYNVGNGQAFGAGLGKSFLALAASEQIADTATLKFVGTGAFEMNGHSETIGSFVSDGPTGTSNAIDTGSATLAVTRSMGLNAPFTFGGHLSLDGNDVSVVVDTTATANFNGTIDNGIFHKSGFGLAIFNGAQGTAVLRIDDNNNRVTGDTRFGGLQGDALLLVAGNGTLRLDTPSTASHTFTGQLGGTGTVVKQGAGSQTFAGTIGNSYSGTLSVAGGTLILNKPAGVVAATGAVDVGAAGNLVTLADRQFAAGSNVVVAGQTDFSGTTQILNSLKLNAGGFVQDGTLQTAAAVTVDAAVMRFAVLGVGAGGLSVTNGGLAEVRGTVAGSSVVDASSSLRVDPLSTDFGPANLTFADILSLNAGAQIFLKPTAAARTAPMIDINGALVVGTLVFSGFQVTGMTGTATVDLSAAAPLTPGTYRLIDFSASGFANNTVYAGLSNFVLVPPSTPGSFAIQNRVLVYTAVPEPVTIVGVTASAFLLRRRRQTSDLHSQY